MIRKIILTFALMCLAVPAYGFASTDGGWVNTCAYSHSLSDDPIVFPSQPGASHLHDFFGNTTTDAYSTYASLRAGTTKCVIKGDTASYWAPALYRNGVRVYPVGSGSRTTIYYVNNLSGYPASAIKPIPKGLRMVAGNSKATSVAENPELSTSGDIYYGCSNNTPDAKFTAPIDCASGIISLHIGFPNCWDGLYLDSADHQSHMAYPVNKGAGYVCPNDHPVPIPRIIMRIEYPVGTNSNGITLSSGPTYTVHGDFFNAWHQKKLNALIDQCIHTNTECGTDPGH